MSKSSNQPGIRVQKFLSQAGVCSRRQAERLMREGRVSINGKPVTELGTRVLPGKDKVHVNGQTVEYTGDLIYVAVYKPRGVITSLSDPEGRPVITDLIPNNLPRLWPVGRLDWDSEGMVLMTNDGKLTHLVTHPSTYVEKSYEVKLRGLLDSKDPGLARMRKPMKLDDGFTTSGADVVVLNNTGLHTWLQVIIHEGHNRQIRRMAEGAGHTVLRLRRTAIGPLSLEGLVPGRWRNLTLDEVLSLYSLVESSPPPKPKKKPSTSKAPRRKGRKRS